ncbi:MAG: glycoside hydrolase family 43 protein [Bacteroidales bacterium]|jgi:beta-xylosidase|nr:glycoside hydrolase family 43 protein [Bacteroidales bacterium]
MNKCFINIIAACFLLPAQPLPAQPTTKELADIHVRDPYILPVAKTGWYYLYKSASVTSESGITVGGVEAWKSKDLVNWEGPVQVFRMPENNWITGRVWAPEVHEYRGKYYLFATLNSDIVWKAAREKWPPYTFRGVQIFWSKSPEGPFKPFSLLPHTPMDYCALDGTLWVEDGVPYMIYCHEWVQLGDGAMNLMPLKKDLSAAAGPSMRLFYASAAPWGKQDASQCVTDGCFLYRTKTGKLLMLWSSFTKEGQYAVGIAESATGKVTGPWRQQEEPLFTADGGHSMLFRTFDGRLCLTLHQPNHSNERARIFDIADTGATLRLIRK